MLHLKSILLFFLASSISCFAADRFVVITDSHGVGEFGGALSDALRARPETSFEFFASGGSAPLQWVNNAFNTTCGLEESSSSPAPFPRLCTRLHTPTLTALWAGQHQGTVAERRITLIVQGTNFGMKSEMKEEQIFSSQKLMLQALDHGQCIWVGPPNMRRAPAFDSAGVEYKVFLIKTALERVHRRWGKTCSFIDSREFSTYPVNGDGIHYHWPGSKDKVAIKRAREWGEGVMARVEPLIREQN